MIRHLSSANDIWDDSCIGAYNTIVIKETDAIVFVLTDVFTFNTSESGSGVLYTLKFDRIVLISQMHWNVSTVFFGLLSHTLAGSATYIQM